MTRLCWGPGRRGGGCPLSPCPTPDLCVPPPAPAPAPSCLSAPPSPSRLPQPCGAAVPLSSRRSPPAPCRLSPARAGPPCPPALPHEVAAGRLLVGEGLGPAQPGLVPLHQVPHRRAAGAALARHGPGLGRRVGHAGRELQLQLHVLRHLGTERGVGGDGDAGPRWPRSPPRSPPPRPHLEEAGPQRLEGDADGEGAALARVAQVVERRVADDGIQRRLRGPALVPGELLSWGGWGERDMARRGRERWRPPGRLRCGCPSSRPIRPLSGSSERLGWKSPSSCSSPSGPQGHRVPTNPCCPPVPPGPC